MGDQVGGSQEEGSLPGLSGWGGGKGWGGMSCLSVSTLIRAGKGAVEGCYGQEEGRGKMGEREKQRAVRGEEKAGERNKGEAHSLLARMGSCPRGTGPGPVAPHTVRDTVPPQQGLNHDFPI